MARTEQPCVTYTMPAPAARPPRRLDSPLASVVTFRVATAMARTAWFRLSAT